MGSDSPSCRRRVIMCRRGGTFGRPPRGSRPFSFPTTTGLDRRPRPPAGSHPSPLVTTAAQPATTAHPALPRDLSRPLFSPAHSDRSVRHDSALRTQQASFLTSQSQVRPRVDRGACESTPVAGDYRPVGCRPYVVIDVSRTCYRLLG
jgi:hypothetical protein